MKKELNLTGSEMIKIKFAMKMYAESTEKILREIATDDAYWNEERIKKEVARNKELFLKLQQFLLLANDNEVYNLNLIKLL
jgi:hypothetical protein